MLKGHREGVPMKMFNSTRNWAGEVKFGGSREAAIFNLDTSMAADGSGREMGNIGQLGEWDGS